MIFSRRTLQRLINENAKVLSSKQSKEHVKRLDRGELGVEWEIVLVNFFSHFGTIQHEANFAGKKPDLFFRATSSDVSFLADIKTVSDEGVEINNPHEFINERLHEELLKNGIRGHWHTEIGGDYESARESGKPVRMKLPAKARINSEIFGEKFELFLEQIKSDPSQRRKFEIRNSSTDISFTYSPRDGWTGSGSYPGYKSIENPKHLIQNSVFSGLIDKADQLKQSKFQGLKGIILCDGDSEFLSKAKSIIGEFFNNSQNIDFVMVFQAVQEFGYDPKSFVDFDVYFREKPPPKIDAFFSEILSVGPSLLPRPIRSARNARHAHKSNKPLRLGSFYGGFTMDSTSIKMPSRTMLDFLAGRIETADFPDDYRAFFASMIDEGRMIVGFEIEVAPEEKDDDWITVNFGNPDPAISPFKVPKRTARN